MSRKKKDKGSQYKMAACALNIRLESSMDSPVVRILSKGEKVEVDLNYKNAKWDHVITEQNVEGYSMKEFLDSLDSDTNANSKDDSDIFHTEHSECDSVILAKGGKVDGEED